MHYHACDKCGHVNLPIKTKVLDLHMQGLTVSEIMKVVKVNNKLIYKYLNMANVKPNTRKFTPYQEMIAILATKYNKDYKEMAKLLGTSPKNIGQMVRGLEKRGML